MLQHNSNLDSDTDNNSLKYQSILKKQIPGKISQQMNISNSQEQLLELQQPQKNIDQILPLTQQQQQQQNIDQILPLTQQQQQQQDQEQQQLLNQFNQINQGSFQQKKMSFKRDSDLDIFRNDSIEEIEKKVLKQSHYSNNQLYDSNNNSNDMNQKQTYVESQQFDQQLLKQQSTINQNPLSNNQEEGLNDQKSISLNPNNLEQGSSTQKKQQMQKLLGLPPIQPDEKQSSQSISAPPQVLKIEDIDRNFIESQIRLYKKKEIQLDKSFANENTLLNLSVINNYCDLIEQLIDSHSINQKNCLGNTPIIEACIQESVKSLKILLKYDPDINIQNKKGQSPLYISVDQQNYQFCEILLKQGAEPNIENLLNSKTPLKLSLDYKNNQIAKLLVKNGAYVDSFINKSGQTLLIDMFLNKNKDGVEFLLKYNTNLKLKNKQKLDIYNIMNNTICQLQNNLTTVEPQELQPYRDIQSIIMNRYNKLQRVSNMHQLNVIMSNTLKNILPRCFVNYQNGNTH